MSSTLREDARRVVWWVLVGAAAGALGVAMLGAIHGVLCAAASGAIPPRLRLPLRMLVAATLGGARSCAGTASTASSATRSAQGAAPRGRTLRV
jgi:hypothetical protein